MPLTAKQGTKLVMSLVVDDFTRFVLNVSRVLIQIYSSSTSYRYSKVDSVSAVWEGLYIYISWGAVREYNQPTNPPTRVFLWLTCRRVRARVLFQTAVFPQCISYVVHNLTSSEKRPEHWMKEEACRNSVHCNNTEFIHRAFCIFLFVSGLLWH